MAVQNKYTERFRSWIEESYRGTLFVSLFMLTGGAFWAFFSINQQSNTNASVAASGWVIATIFSGLSLMCFGRFLRRGTKSMREGLRVFRNARAGRDVVFMLHHRSNKNTPTDSLESIRIEDKIYYDDGSVDEAVAYRVERRNHRMPGYDTSEFAIHIQMSGKECGPILQLTQNGIPVFPLWMGSLNICSRSRMYTRLGYCEGSYYQEISLHTLLTILHQPPAGLPHPLSAPSLAPYLGPRHDRLELVLGFIERTARLKNHEDGKRLIQYIRELQGVSNTSVAA